MARIVRNYHTPWGKTYKDTFFKDNDGIECLKSIFGITAPMRANCNQNCYNLRKRNKTTRPAQFCLALATFPNYTANIHDIRKRIPNLRESQNLLNAKAVCNEAKLTVFNNHTKLWTLTDFGKAYLMWLNGMEPTQVFSWLGEKGEKVNDAAFEEVIGLPSCYKTAENKPKVKVSETVKSSAKAAVNENTKAKVGKTDKGAPYVEFVQAGDTVKSYIQGLNRIFELDSNVNFSDATAIMDWIRENVPYNAAKRILNGEAFAFYPHAGEALSVMGFLCDSAIVFTYQDGYVKILNKKAHMDTAKITSLYNEYKELTPAEKKIFMDLLNK